MIHFFVLLMFVDGQLSYLPTNSNKVDGTEDYDLELSFDDLLEETRNERLVLINDASGMGKTSEKPLRIDCKTNARKVSFILGVKRRCP